MKRTVWNDHWRMRKLNTEDAFQQINVPYDCMLHEKRSDEAPGGCNNGWFEGYDYEFLKTLHVAQGDEVAHRWIEFEGVYHQAEVYVNDEKVAYRPNGYLALMAEITSQLHEGDNQIRVIARGADIPNSRWYTGVGIYRDVWLYEAEEQYIKPASLRITTESITPATLRVTFETQGRGKAQVAILFGNQVVAEQPCESDGKAEVRFVLPEASLWSPEQPNLYTCRVTFEKDVAEETFGIRTISCDAAHGFCLNGERVLLRGACVHHDNGLLGAVSIPEAEKRKIQLLKSVGFNAIRSAHNPCSKALLQACDQLGMMVMEEYVDCWYIHKTKYDYAPFVQEWYERDLTDMVRKDYNHPCVVLYSLGNEVTESAQERGVALFRAMRDCLKSQDATRPVTCGINIGFNQATAAGHSFFSDEKAAKNDFHNLGTEDANHRKWKYGPLLTKANAILPGCDRATRDVFAASDIAGYNYGLFRYLYDRKKYPKRVILGSETFCEDAERFMRAAKRDIGIIGDFVWTGMDHIGEVGLGAWEYKDYAPTYIHTKGWLTSGCGRIDITGKLLPEAYYMTAAYGLLKKPCIAVLQPHHLKDRHSPSGWKFTNAVSSWAWDGCEGMKTKVEVYGCGDHVELFLNGRRLGRKSLKRHCRVLFDVAYQPGVLTAIVYNAQHEETGRECLKSADGKTVLLMEPEKQWAKAGKLSYIRLRLSDGAGTTKVMERERIHVSVEGGELVALGHACCYNEDGYVSDTTGTYMGEALAIVRAGAEGTLTVHAQCGEMETKVQLRIE